ncbi:hypothetical protein BU17DRAFT_70688 [Hysterangium stoloniferum]|nr:hypothetical protein BU17DRAFT_70688 [Hysterangium stoloniferum]
MSLLMRNYPTQDKDGAVSPVSSTPYHHIPPHTPLHRRVLITTRKRSSLAYAASHPVVAAIALVLPGIQAASRSRLQRATGTHALTQQHEAFKAHIADCHGRPSGWGPYSGVGSTSFDFTLAAIRSGRTYANGNNRPITLECCTLID